MKILTNGTPKILQKQYSFSGAHKFSEDLLSYIAQTRHSYCGVAFTKPTDRIPNNFQTRIKKIGKQNRWLVVSTQIDTADILSLATNKPRQAALDIVRRLSDQIKKQNADVFYLNGFSAMSFLLFKAVQQAGLPIVAGHHGIWVKESLAIVQDYPAHNLKLRIKAEAQLARHATKNIFLTAAGLKEYEKLVSRVPEKQATIIPLPYDPVFLNPKLPARHAASRGPLSIGMVARWDKVKNHEAFLAAARHAQEQNLDWQFFAVTRLHPYPPYRTMEKEYAQRIKILPQMPPRQLKKFYQKMDVIVSPSAFETYSGVVMESLLQNRPVVISPHVPWTKEYKQYGLRRLITDFKNPQKTVRILQVAANTPISAKIIAKIRKTNKPQAIYAEYLKTFQTAINQKRS